MTTGKALVTGSCGLVGSESVAFFIEKGFQVVGIDNDMRAYFFGKEASTYWQKERLLKKYNGAYHHYDLDIRNYDGLVKIFKDFKPDLIIHTAAQPSHDWAAKDPFTDFTINANGTLNLLEAMRNYAPDAVFIYTSTNKVYGDEPNRLPIIELEKRYEISPDHKYSNGIDETMSVDQNLHSLFGASKLAGDILVQEYGRYFGLKTVSFRGGCLTGPQHSGTQLHGFLSYLVRCAITGKVYNIFGYKGKQVRDNIHSYDLVNAFYHYYLNPIPGAVYNIGGGRFSNCSILEAIEIIEDLTGKKVSYHYVDVPRRGDHIWYISDVSKFRKDYPAWNYTYNLRQIIAEIYEFQKTLPLEELMS
ncbi:MAG: NAD-dependent epimerase/dehydratase family protein [candidate division WOR-3 bacterium]|nr:NAD-dependent epimerase/dehydratase family protein [candidate division WOR-3 bacterium]MCX7757821.1 NAD-dependent epimerase/dehydratase family protein [candidate division WOR-3 bacterium]MDW7987098.1 NAD-dependent epimerase/dehydratase family protein [candidate division WOR-3 bacterium]